MSFYNQKENNRFCPQCNAKVPVNEVQIIREIYIEGGDCLNIPEAFFKCEHGHLFMSPSQLDGNIYRYYEAIQNFVNT